MAQWTIEDIPDLGGRTAVITGSNTGIGLETAAALAGAGATVVLACRNLTKAEAARATIAERHPKGEVELLQLDLADQSQIAHAAAEATERFSQIDLLINNAGVLGLPRTLTVDGFEALFGVNHLGHYAFTGRLLPSMLEVKGSRVVTVASRSHRLGAIRWDDLTGEQRYTEMRAYAQSKLANLLFTLELQSRLARAGAATSSLAAHPGFAATDIAASRVEKHPRFAGYAIRFIPTPDEAARPSLRAATAPDAYGGQFYGPSGRGGIAGPPVHTRPAARALDEDAQARLWQVSEELTGVTYPV